MLQYPAFFDADGEGFSVSFRDIPIALTSGSTIEEAYELAADALLTAMDLYFEDPRSVPMPSKKQDGEVFIALPLSISAKVLLLNEMIAQDVTPAELASRLNHDLQDVTQIMNLNDVTKIDTISDAFTALGRRLDVTVA